MIFQKDGNELASRSPDLDDNCRTSSCGTRRVHLRPPRGPGGPKLARKSPQQFLKQSWILNGFQIVQGHRGVKNNDFSKKYFRHQSGRHWPDLDDRRYFGVQQLILGGTFWAHSCPRRGGQTNHGKTNFLDKALFLRTPCMLGCLQCGPRWNYLWCGPGGTSGPCRDHPRGRRDRGSAARSARASPPPGWPTRRPRGPADPSRASPNGIPQRGPLQGGGKNIDFSERIWAFFVPSVFWGGGPWGRE